MRRFKWSFGRKITQRFDLKLLQKIFLEQKFTNVLAHSFPAFSNIDASRRLCLSLCLSNDELAKSVIISFGKNRNVVHYVDETLDNCWIQGKI
jgi:hypothetical protein